MGAVPAVPPGIEGGAEERPDEEEDDDEDDEEVDEEGVEAGALDWIFCIDEAAAWSVSRDVWAVALVLAPALSAAAAAFSAPPRAVWMAWSACCMAT